MDSQDQGPAFKLCRWKQGDKVPGNSVFATFNLEIAIFVVVPGRIPLPKKKE
jgi:hypothetical protein